LQDLLEGHARQAMALGGRLAAWLRCLETGETFAVDGDRQVSAVSTIKVPVLIELFRQAGAGRCRLAEAVPVSNPWKAEGSGVLKELDAGLHLTWWDLATLMIIVSDNIAANLILDLVGLDGVNGTLRDLGLTRTVLRRKFLGRLTLPEADNLTTAADMGLCMERLARGQAAGAAADAEMLGILRRQQDKTMAAFYLPGAAMAHKTGWNDAVPHVGDVGLYCPGHSTWAFALFCTGTAAPLTARLVLAALMRDVAAAIHRREREVAAR
jgi:beta-lactamase class A